MSRAVKRAGAAEPQRFRPYSAHKDSGVEWLGEIPVHWVANRLKYAIALNPQPDPWGVVPDADASFVPMEAVGEYGGLDLSRTMQVSSIGAGYTYFRDGDVIVAKITPCFENGKGACAAGLVNGIAFGTTELHVLRPNRNLDQRFLFYVTLSAAFRGLGEGEMYGAGGQQRVPESFIANLRHPTPPLSEQRDIAAFLDRETERIDALVAKKVLLVELLREKRTALITRAVTQGLDPNVTMKDSGIEWLGNVPAHWDVKNLSRLLRVGPRNGISPAIDPDGVTPTFSTAAVSDGVVVIDEHVKYTTINSREAQAFLVLEGDVLLLRGSGSRPLVGRAGIIIGRPPHGCIYPDILIRLRPAATISSWFLVNCLNSSAIRPQIESAAKTASGIWKITSEDVKGLVIPVPPYSEQVRLEAEVSHILGKIDAAVTGVHNAISHLNELRTALISAAVTGKIDVRESA